MSVLGISLSETDRPNADLDAVIAADTTITIDQVTYKSLTLTETMAYETEVIEIDTIERGSVNYLQYGKEGSKNLYYTVEYINGQETNRTKDWEEVTEWPVKEIYEKGVGGSFVGADGKTYTYSLRRVVPATYYDIEGPTWLGPNAGEWCIAVDFDYIPLGTELYVKNAKYDFGLRTAADTGSAIEEWEIDIWIGPDNPYLADFAYIGYHYDLEIYYVD
jgi:3D (Asp-Asp-Asp) domain-containing protein